MVVIPFIMWLPGMVSIFNKLVLSRRWHLFGSTQREARENCKRVKPKFPRAVNVSIGFSAGSRVRV